MLFQDYDHILNRSASRINNNIKIYLPNHFFLKKKKKKKKKSGKKKKKKKKKAVIEFVSLPCLVEPSTSDV
jgi:hypothetical protein